MSIQEDIGKNGESINNAPKDSVNAEKSEETKSDETNTGSSLETYLSPKNLTLVERVENLYNLVNSDILSGSKIEKDSHNNVKESSLSKNFTSVGSVEQLINISNNSDLELLRNNSSIKTSEFEFVQVGSIGYINKLNSSYKAYFESLHIDLLVKHFSQNRVLIINHDSESRYMSMALMEEVVFKSRSFSKYLTLSCEIGPTGNDTPLELFLKEFNKYPSKDSTNSTIVVIYENLFPNHNRSKLLDTFQKSGGSLDNATTRLNDSNLFIIYMLNSEEPWNTGLRNSQDVSVLHLTHIHNIIYRKIKNYEAANAIYEKISDANFEFNLLSNLNKNEVVKRIEELCDSQDLDSLLDYERSKNIADNEHEFVKELLKEPLNKIILLLATYFENITIREFTEVVFEILKGKIAEGGQNLQGESNSYSELLKNWENDNYSVIYKCGLIAEDLPSNRGLKYTFKTRFRKECVHQVIVKRYDVLFSLYKPLVSLLYSHGLTRDFDEGIKSYLLDLAIGDHKHLLEVCFGLVDSLKSENQRYRRRIFDKLMKILQAWEESKLNSTLIELFYKELLKNENSRSIFSALLTYNCRPENPQFLKRLKSLLEASGHSEFILSLKMIELVYVNFLSELSIFYNEIEQWPQDKSGNSSKAYASVKLALILFFNKRINERVLTTNQSTEVITEILNDKNYLGLITLAEFLFCRKSKSALFSFFKDRKLPGLDNNTPEDIFILLGMVLIVWHEILSLVLQENKASYDFKPTYIIKLCILEIKKDNPEFELIRTGLVNVFKVYDSLLLHNISFKSENEELYSLYLNRREIAREIIAISDSN